MTTFRTMHLYILLLCLTVACCAPKQTSFKTAEKFCGPTLTYYLHSICENFYEPDETDLVTTTSQKDIAEECCHTPCSALYLTLAYCKRPKVNVIKRVYGEDEYNHFHNLRKNISDNTLAMVYKDKVIPDPVKPISETQKIDGTLRQNKHNRKHRQKRCQCLRNPKALIKKRKTLLERIVPEYAIGEVELHDNEPIILTNNFN